MEDSTRHADWGAPHGILHSSISGDRANIACDLCGHVVVSVPAADLEQTLDLRFLMLLLILAARNALAEAIAFTLTTTATGTIGSLDFTNALVTIRNCPSFLR